jgi:hypothetical protein
MKTKIVIALQPVASYIPIILATHVSILPVPTDLSATTMLATTGHDCLMNPSSTSKHEEVFCITVHPAKPRYSIN